MTKPVIRSVATGRAVPEWIGSSPDAKIPDHVKLRIWRAHEGRCWITGRKIRPGDPYDFDHKIALINGGEHRESNLAPALRDKHREKTAEDVKAKAKGDRAAMRAAGISKPKHNWPKRPMRGFASNARDIYEDIEAAE